MARVKSKDTTPELIVRRLAHGLGFRFRLHRKQLPGTPDLVFSRLRKIIFVHGCFWHGHQHPDCRRSRIPKSRVDFWLNKIRRNSDRDAKNKQQLIKDGWDVLEIWECETPVTKRPALEEKLGAFLRNKRPDRDW